MIGLKLGLMVMALGSPETLTTNATELPRSAAALLLMLEDERWLGDGELERLLREGSDELQAASARSAGRIGDPLLLGALLDLLASPTANVRREAVFALGEIGDPAAEPRLEASLDDPDPGVRLVTIEALGKIRDPRAERPLVDRLLGVETPSEEKGAILLQLWKLRSPEAVRKALEFVTSDDAALRRRAVYSLLRSRYEDAVPELIARLLDPDSHVRSLAARALGPTRSPDAVEPLLALLVREREAGETPVAEAGDEQLSAPVPAWQVRVAVVRSLGELKDQRAEAALIGALSDPNPNVEAAAIEALGECGGRTAVDPLSAQLGSERARMRGLAVEALARIDAESGRAAVARARMDPLWSVRAAAVRSSAQLGDRDVLVAAFTDPDARVVAEALTAYAETKAADVSERLAPFLRNADPVVRSVAIDHLGDGGTDGAVNTGLLLDAWERSKSDSILDARFSALGALAPSLNEFTVQKAFFEALKDRDWLVRQKAVELMRLAGKKGEAITAGRVGTGRGPGFYEQLVDWAESARPRVAFLTGKGRIVVELWPAEAPLAVYNIVKLARAGYFDGLVWHRVVPNFVVQTGCPRGDGWGGPGYAIRCEINPRRFTRGAVGMALAGKDTGGGQFFIAHSDQPHLDGGYTVFGRVIEGMAIVDSVTQEDGILSASVEKLDWLPAEAGSEESGLGKWEARPGAPVVSRAPPSTQKQRDRLPRTYSRKPARSGGALERGTRTDDTAVKPESQAVAAGIPEPDVEAIKKAAEARAERDARERRRLQERAARERREEEARRRELGTGGAKTAAVSSAEAGGAAGGAVVAPAPEPDAAAGGERVVESAADSSGPASGQKPVELEAQTGVARADAETDARAAQREREAEEAAAKVAREKAKSEQQAAKQAEETADKASREKAKSEQQTAKQAEESAEKTAREKAKSEQQAAKQAEKAAEKSSREKAKAEQQAAKQAEKAAEKSSREKAKAEQQAAKQAEESAEKTAREKAKAEEQAAKQAEEAAAKASREKAKAEEQAAKQAEEAADKASREKAKAEEQAAKQAEEAAEKASRERARPDDY